MSEIGRWNGTDPILNQRPDSLLSNVPRLLTLSPYDFVTANPVNFKDPDGKCPKPADTDQTVCIALFIKSETAYGLEGDGREFDSNSDPSKSRVFIHISLEEQTATYTVNETCTTGGECEPPSSDNEVDITFSEDGQINIQVEAINSVRPNSSPAINASFTLTPRKNGTYRTAGDRDAYPSAEAYIWQDGNATALFQRDEKNPLYLFPIAPNDTWNDDE